MNEHNSMAFGSGGLPMLSVGEAEQVDPVCGMKVRPDRAAGKVEHGGRTYFFCSKSCAERFHENPERYLNSDAGSVSPEPAERPELAREGAVYTCPMHPQIVRDGPGSCPICGMALEPRTVTAEEEANPELIDMTRRLWVSAALSVP
jgi:Cu+-exporting ATPase